MAHPTADKNFRLTRDVLPSRHAATLTIHPAAKTFTGRQRIDLQLGQACKEVVLHANELEIGKCLLGVNGKNYHPAKVRLEPVSETAILEFAEELPAGEAWLEMEWSGKFCAGLRGLYSAGSAAVTQFEAADARRVFPCFDEPAFKATWALTVVGPVGFTILSNGEQLDRTIQGDQAVVAFRETPPLSSYLIAVVMGKLEGCPTQEVGGIDVRTWAIPEKANLTTFGQEVAVNVLPMLEDYFGIPYAFGKVDQVGVPDFEAGAMENAGLITYREVALLLDPNTAALRMKKRVAEVVTHELSHQWFGNWVTMVWWDDLWLNEAFATWMSYKIVDKWRPDWRVWLDFDAGKAAALHLDALRSTHPIRAVIHNAQEAGESFDAITYEKGGAVLRMIEGYLGEIPFRDGIRAYMRRHGQANAVANDLWTALAESSKQPVVELADTWIGQSGYPLVSVTQSGNTLKLAQRRFFSEPEVSGPESWPVPMVFRYQDSRGVQEERHLFRGATGEYTLKAQGEVKWLCANGGATGFYRVAYDPASLGRLRTSIAQLQSAERVAVIADQWALVRAGAQSIDALLDLVFAFEGEEDHAVLDELVTRLAYVEHRLLQEADRPKFAARVTQLFSKQLQKLGWDAKSGETDEVKLRRSALVRALGLLARSPELIAEARGRLDRFLGGDGDALEPNLQDSAVVMSARSGDVARFNQLLQRFKDEKDPAYKQRYLLSLAAFEDPALAKRASEMFLGPDVPQQDFAMFVAGLLGNRVAREGAWKLLQDRWPEVESRASTAPMLFRRVIEAMGQMPERRHYEAVTAFMTAHPVEGAKQATTQTLERMRQDADMRDRCMGPLSSWLQR
jgi:puromycin-sensitive aminopeptidase